MRFRPQARFSAVLAPSGIHLVQYRRGRRGLHVVRYSSDLTRYPNASAAAEGLADLVEAEGGRGSRLALAVAGFGSYHHILTLPRAPREVLAPVIQREMRRFYPQLFPDDRGAPAIEFIEVDTTGRATGGQVSEFLVAGVPGELLEQVHGQLAAREIELEHWTILPRALQRLYDVFVGEDDTSALLVMLPRNPLLGLFHEGSLRLFSEPLSHHPRGDEVGLEAVLEQAERGGLFLRQQFRGASVERFVLAAEPPDSAQLMLHLQARLEVPAEMLEPWGNAPGAVAALGAALDVGSEGRLNLLPETLAPRPVTERWTRGLAVASAAVLVAAAGWWAWSGVHTARVAEAAVQSVESRLSAYDDALTDVRSVVDARRAHTERILLLESLAGPNELLPAVLWPLDAAPEGVRIQSLQMRRVETGWEGAASGLASGYSSAEVARSVDTLYEALARELPEGAARLSRLAYVDPPAEGEVEPVTGPPIAISFEISFIIPAVEEVAP